MVIMSYLLVCHHDPQEFGFKFHSLINPPLPVIVHYIVMNTFKGAVNLKCLHPGQQLAFKLHCH